jgi:hypothetical protein
MRELLAVLPKRLYIATKQQFGVSMSVISEAEALEALEKLGMGAGPVESVGREDLKKPGVIVHLGVLAARSLYHYGTAVFCVDPEGEIVQANPLHVYLKSDAIVPNDTAANNFNWVRPVLGSGAPRYAAWRDGILWEIEFVTEEKKDDLKDDKKEDRARR